MMIVTDRVTILPGSVWEYNQGGSYRVICCAVNVRTMQEEVIYAGLAGSGGTGTDRNYNLACSLADFVLRFQCLLNPWPGPDTPLPSETISIIQYGNAH